MGCVVGGPCASVCCAEEVQKSFAVQAGNDGWTLAGMNCWPLYKLHISSHDARCAETQSSPASLASATQLVETTCVEILDSCLSREAREAREAAAARELRRRSVDLMECWALSIGTCNDGRNLDPRLDPAHPLKGSKADCPLFLCLWGLMRCQAFKFHFQHILMPKQACNGGMSRWVYQRQGGRKSMRTRKINLKKPLPDPRTGRMLKGYGPLCRVLSAPCAKRRTKRRRRVLTSFLDL